MQRCSSAIQQLCSRMLSKADACMQGLTEPQHWHQLAEECVVRCTELVQDVTHGQPGPNTIIAIDRISDEVVLIKCCV